MEVINQMPDIPLKMLDGLKAKVSIKGLKIISKGNHW
jgi:hypothetical protein